VSSPDRLARFDELQSNPIVKSPLAAGLARPGYRCDSLNAE
jgi:hypothetical protein